MFTDSAKNPVWPRCYFGTRDTWLDRLSLFSTEVITITFISPWIPPSDDHVQILSKLADDGYADSALYQSKSNVLQELILCLRSYISTCLQLGVHGICQSNNFPVLRFLIPTPNSVGRKHRWSVYLWNISLSDLPFGSRPNIWQVFDKF